MQFSLFKQPVPYSRNIKVTSKTLLIGTYLDLYVSPNNNKIIYGRATSFSDQVNITPLCLYIERAVYCCIKAVNITQRTVVL